MLVPEDMHSETFAFDRGADAAVVVHGVCGIDPSDPVFKMLKRLEKKEGKDFSDKHNTLKNIRNSSRE